MKRVCLGKKQIVLFKVSRKKLKYNWRKTGDDEKFKISFCFVRKCSSQIIDSLERCFFRLWLLSYYYPRWITIYWRMWRRSYTTLHCFYDNTSAQILLRYFFHDKSRKVSCFCIFFLIDFHCWDIIRDFLRVHSTMTTHSHVANYSL